MDTQQNEKAHCANCGADFKPSRTWSAFCSLPCQQGFANRMKTEGRPLAPLVKAWIATRHAKPGTREAKICAFARQQLTAIASMFNDTDKESERGSAVDYVETLMKSGTLYMDRARR